MFAERLAGQFTSSPVMIDGNIFAVNETGEVFVFEAKPEFRLLAKNSIGERVFSSPAVADGRLYIRGDRSLFCIGEKK